MFTGLVQSRGKVIAVRQLGQERRFQLLPERPFSELRLGESIAVNGVCLTVEEFRGSLFTVYASAQTLSQTNLGSLTPGSRVNLERALRVQDRLGGHLVSGHVDCLAVVDDIRPKGESMVFRLRFPKSQGTYVVDKGSVALDGISLTVTNCGTDYLEVNIIPATQGETTIKDWQKGSIVNMETDLIAKYVKKMLQPWQDRGEDRDIQGPSGAITLDFLQKHGF